MARLEWLDAILKDGKTGQITKAEKNIFSALDRAPHKTWIDVAAKLCALQHKELESLTRKIVDNATARTFDQLKQAESVEEKRIILSQLSRFHGHETGQWELLVKIWEREVAANVGWLQNESMDWWEVASFAMMAHGRVRGVEAAREMRNRWLNDSRISDAGRELMLMRYGRLMAQLNRKEEADAVYGALTALGRKNHVIGYGFYWQMLRALARRDYTEAKAKAREVLQCLTIKNGSDAAKRMVVQARLLIDDMRIPNGLSKEEKKYWEDHQKYLLVTAQHGF